MKIVGTAPSKHEIERALVDTEEDEASKAARADEGGDDRKPDRLHGDDAKPGEEENAKAVIGASTRKRICPPVISMPRAVSTTEAARLASPAKAPRAIGKSE